MNKNIDIEYEFMKAVVNKDKILASMILKNSNAFKKKRINYQYELIEKKSQDQYIYDLDSNNLKHINDLLCISYNTVKEILIIRDNKRSTCRWQEGTYTFYKEKNKGKYIKIYRYEERNSQGFIIERYLTTDKKILNKIYSKITEYNLNLTGHYPIYEIFYNDFSYAKLSAYLFLEHINRCIDRDCFGTNKMHCKITDLFEHLINIYNNILPSETLWWDNQRKRKLAVDYSNKEDFLNNYNLFSVATGGINRAEYDIENLKEILINKGLLKEYIKKENNSSLKTYFTGITNQGWELINNICKKYNIDTNNHIIDDKVLQELVTIFNDIKLNNKEQYDIEFQSELDKRRVKYGKRIID